MKIELRHWTVDEWRASAGEWQALLLSSSADPVFLSHAWQTTWWSLYGNRGRELCVLAAYAAGKLVGIAPFYLEDGGLPGVRVRVACLIGGARHFGGDAGMMSEYLDIVSAPGSAAQVRSEVLAHLFGKVGVDECRVTLTGNPEAWVAAASARSDIVPAFRHSNPAISYQADLSNGLADYLSRLSSTVRRSLWNRRALLASLGAIRFEEVAVTDLADGFDELNTMHALRWGQQVYNQKGVSFHTSLARAWGLHGRTNLTKLSVGGELLSILYDITVGKFRYNIQMGFNDKYDSRVSLGFLHLGFALEQAARDGVTTYDFLAGTGRVSDYKSRLSQRRRDVCDLVASRHPMVSRGAAYADGKRRRLTRRFISPQQASIPKNDWRHFRGVVRTYLESDAPKPRLRVGVMLDSMQLRRPFAHTLAQVVAANFADLVVVVQAATDSRSQQGSRRNILARIVTVLKENRRRRQVLFALYERFDRFLHPNQQSQMDSVDVADLLADTELVVARPMRAGYDIRFAASDIQLLRERQLDVLLRFGFGIIRGDILNAAKFGVWSYHHGDNEFFRGGPSGFWELFEQAPLTGAILQQLNDTLDGGRVLARIQAPTKLGYSLTSNRLAPYLSAQSLVIQKLRDLHRFGWDYISQESASPLPYRGLRKLYKAPTNVEMCGFLGRRAVEAARRRLPRWLGGGRRRPGMWRVGVRRNSGALPWTRSLQDWCWIEPPAGHYFADPILCDWRGQTYLFVEDFDLAEGKGSISVTSLSNDGRPEGFRKILTRPYHLSFPNVFSREGEMFLVPETRSAGRIELYRAEKFPDTWRRERTILAYPGVESVLFPLGGGRELLITGIADAPQAQVSMHIFIADGLQSDWRPHPQSPVHCDVRYSRNSGPLLHLPGEGLVRVSQDGSVRYGRQMHFHRIKDITTEKYLEEYCATITGTDVHEGAIGTHTYSASTKWQAVDALVC